MHATSTFTVVDMTATENPTQVGDVSMITTAAPAGFAYLTKAFSGDLTGRSITWFVGCLNEQTGAGSYAAVEAVAAELDGRRGTFNVVHAASTHGTDRFDEHFTIVAGSGTGDLAGLSGTGSIVIDADGTHHLNLDYELDGG